MQLGGRVGMLVYACLCVGMHGGVGVWVRMGVWACGRVHVRPTCGGAMILTRPDSKYALLLSSEPSRSCCTMNMHNDAPEPDTDPDTEPDAGPGAGPDAETAPAVVLS